MAENNSRAAVIIPTRNRGASVLATVTSLLDNTHESIEVLVVDQSPGFETLEAINAHCVDRRLRYVRSETLGASAARNHGASLTDADFLLFTDDDCRVPADWVHVMVETLKAAPAAALAFCSVVPAPHDQSNGTIPHHKYRRLSAIKSLLGYYRHIGMSAGVIFRRDAFEALNGFDACLGSGSLFRSAEDHDIAVRALISGFAVLETPQTEVIHDGFRTNSEFRVLTERDWYGLGAAECKHVRRGYAAMLILAVGNSLYYGVWQPVSLLLHLKKPIGFRRFYFFWKGFADAWRAPLCRETGQFDPSNGNMA